MCCANLHAELSWNNVSNGSGNNWFHDLLIVQSINADKSTSKVHSVVSLVLSLSADEANLQAGLWVLIKPALFTKDLLQGFLSLTVCAQVWIWYFQMTRNVTNGIKGHWQNGGKSCYYLANCDNSCQPTQSGLITDRLIWGKKWCQLSPNNGESFKGKKQWNISHLQQASDPPTKQSGGVLNRQTSQVEMLVKRQE